MEEEQVNTILDAVVEELQLRKFSPKTVQVYSYYIQKFLESNCSYRTFFVRLSNHSENTIRLASAAIRFYLKQENIYFDNITLPKKPKKLPVVLSKREIELMINRTANIKHKLVISLLYSAGLRLSELINLRWEDVDVVRNIINIRKGKGKKDRTSLLSKKVKKLLREYRLTIPEKKIRILRKKRQIFFKNSSRNHNTCFK